MPRLSHLRHPPLDRALETSQESVVTHKTIFLSMLWPRNPLRTTIGIIWRKNASHLQRLRHVRLASTLAHTHDRIHEGFFLLLRGVLFCNKMRLEQEVEDCPIDIKANSIQGLRLTLFQFCIENSGQKRGNNRSTHFKIGNDAGFLVIFLLSLLKAKVFLRIIASPFKTNVEGEFASTIRLPHSIQDEEEECSTWSRRSSVRSQSPTAPSQLHLEEKEEEKALDHWTEQDTAQEMPLPLEFIRRSSTSKLESAKWTSMDPIVPMNAPPQLDSSGTTQSSKRRVMCSMDEISPRALDRLGVNADILKKEKGMKKLGICDVDIIRSEELRRYTGVSQLEPSSKAEFMFGFNEEQLHRERAIKRLGTTEQEIMDDYSRRISRLGVSNSFPVQP